MMDLFLSFLTLVISLFILGTAAKYVVENSIKLAHYFRISELAVGFILVAFLTSLPEFSVAIISFSAGEGAVSLGDLLGSSITNIALILGICFLIRSTRINEKNEKSTSIVFLLLSLAPLLLILDGEIGFFDGLIFIALFLIFVYLTITKHRKIENKEKMTKREALNSFLIFILSAGIVIASAGFVVSSAVDIATEAGLIKSFIGATVIALGTSLPELAVNIAAVRRRKVSLALGNIIGSNVMNLTLILGIGTLISPLKPNMAMVWSIIGFVILSTIVFSYFLWKGKRLSRREGGILLAIYILYLLWISGVQMIHF